MLFQLVGVRPLHQFHPCRQNYFRLSFSSVAPAVTSSATRSPVQTSTPQLPGPASATPHSGHAATAFPTAPPSTSTAASAVDTNLVTGAIAAAHASISGELQLLPTISTSFSMENHASLAQLLNLFALLICHSIHKFQQNSRPKFGMRSLLLLAAY